jgi:hypothetical protein
MLVPGASSADYTLGDTGNEPLSVQWRNLIPLCSTGNIQMLDAVEQTADSGTPSPGFSQFLARGRPSKCNLAHLPSMTPPGTRTLGLSRSTGSTP